MPERPYVKTLSSYSRMALAVRGWGFEVALGTGVFALWRLGVALDGEGLGILVLGILGIALWRVEEAEPVAGPDAAGPGNRALVQPGPHRLRGHQPPRPDPPGRSDRVHPGRPAACSCVCPPGLTAELLEEAGESLAATIGARDVRVLREPANASLAHFSIIFRDPLSVPAPPWPVPPGLVVGADLPRRRRGRQPGPDRHCPSATSCSAASPEPASRRRSPCSSPRPRSIPSVTLTLLDGKQVELAPWSGSAEHFVGPDMAGAIEVLKDLCAEMDRRYAILLASGLRKIEPDGEFGLHVVAIDELAFYMRGGTKDERTELTETLRDLDLEGTGGRHDRHRRHPEAHQRDRPDLRPGPLLLPHGAALHHPRGLRHRSSARAGPSRATRPRPSTRPPGAWGSSWPKGPSRSRSAPTTSTTTPSPSWLERAQSAEERR